jgi:hypothetical protein
MKSDLEQTTEELGVAVSELTVVTKKLKEATDYDLETAQFHLNEYERKHHWGEVQKHYEEEEELETDTAHEIATEDLNQDSFYCQWRVVKENMETNPIKAYFALEKMHGDHGDCDAASDYDTNLGLEDGTGAKTPTSELDDAHLGVYKDYRIVEHYLLSQCPPGTKHALPESQTEEPEEEELGPDLCMNCDKYFDQHREILWDDEMKVLWEAHQDGGHDGGDLCPKCLVAFMEALPKAE